MSSQSISFIENKIFNFLHKLFCSINLVMARLDYNPHKLIILFLKDLYLFLMPMVLLFQFSDPISEVLNGMLLV